MHRLFLGFSLFVFTSAVLLTGCGQSDKPVVAQGKEDEKVPPGEAKPIPPGEAKPVPPGTPGTTDPDGNEDTVTETKTDQDFLPVLPKLSAPTGDEKYDASLGRAFLLVAEKKNAEALEALKEALAAKETDFVKEEIERLEAKITREEGASKAVDDIKEVLEAGKAAEASQLATDALGTYGDSEQAETITGLKRQADALLSASLEDNVRKQRFLGEAEAARKANNLRSAVLAYEQAVASGADAGELKDTYEGLRTRLVKYDENRTRANELRKDSSQLETAVTTLKVAAENWDTQQVRQEISEAEFALQNRRDRVAIADFEVIEDIGIPRAGHAIAEEMMGFMRPRFDVVERSQVRTLMAEMKLDNDTLASDDTSRSEFGRIAKARYVVLGSVNRLAGIRVNARLVDTQTGLVVQTAQIAAANPAEMTNRLPALGKMLQMNDDEKRNYERELAEQARPVAPAQPPAEIPAPPPPPTPDVAMPPPPPPIVVYTPRPPEYGRMVVADFDGFRVIAVGAPPPPPIVVVEAPVVVRDRAMFVAVEVGDNHFRRGDFRLALRHFEFALSLNPGHAGLRMRVMHCRPLCPPPVVVVPVYRPRLVVLPFAEFRDPFAIPSSIPPYLGQWTGDAIAPYFHGRYDVVDKGELFWWMGRLGLTMRDVMTNPYARLCLGRALGARYFLMGSLREVASFDATTHLIDAELNVQTHGARIRVNNAAELRYRLGELSNLMFMPPQQQVIVVQQQQVVQRKVVAAQLEFRKGNFAVSLGFYKEVLVANPQHAEARQMMIEINLRSRRTDMEAQQRAAWQQQQAARQVQRERQIAFAAAAEGARVQANYDKRIINAQQQTILAQQQIIAQQNLMNQALLARRQNNLERRVTLLENANSIRRDDKVAQELAEAKAELAVERQKRLAAEKELRDTQRTQLVSAEVAKASPQLVAARTKQDEVREERRKAEETRVQAEYDRFLDQGQRAMAAQKYPLAVTSFQNARKLKPSPEVEKLVSSALTEQARADAEAKGDAEKKKLEAELAQEKEKSQQLEIQNAKLRTKYQAALAQGQDAMKERRYDQAVTSFRLASATMQTDEATAGLKQAETELAKSRVAADAEAKKKAEEDRNSKLVAQRLNEGRTALPAKQYDKAVVAFRAAANLKPGDVEIQKSLSEAEQARDKALADARKQKEENEKEGSVRRLVLAGEKNVKAKQYDAAIVSFGDALKLDPDNKDAKAGLTQAQTAQGTVKMDAAAQAAAKQKRAEYEQAMRQGRAALNLKQYPEALASFKKAQALLPGDAASEDLIEEVGKRQTTADTAAATQKKNAELTQAIASGRAALRSQKFDEAQVAADRATKLNPENAEVKKLTADIAEAKRVYTAAIQKKDMNAKKSAEVDGLLAKARAAIQAKDLDAATKFIADAKAIDATDPDIKSVQAELTALQNRMINDDLTQKHLAQRYTTTMKAAQAAFDAKRYDEAIVKANDALKLKPGDDAATQLLAAAKKADGAADSAAMDAKKKQEAYTAAMREASTAYAAKKYAIAVREAKVALVSKPGDAAATKILNDAQKALDSAGTAAMEAEKKKEAYDAAMKLGRAAMAKKEYDDAAKAFNDALKADPGDPTATALLKQAKDGQAAMTGDAKRKELYDAWLDRAKKLMAAKQYDDAVEAYQNCLKAIPGDPVATRGLAEARSAMNAKKDPVPPKKDPLPPKKDPVPPKKDPVPPKKDPPKAENNAAKVAALLKEAADEEKAGKYAEAYATYQEVLKLAPGNADAKTQSVFCQWMDQGKRQLAAGKNAEAAVSFEQALKIDPTDANAKALLAQARPPKKKK